MTLIERLKVEHEGEWLLILVTDWDKFGAREGELFYHSKDKDDIVRKMDQVPQDKSKSYDMAVVYAGPLVPEGTGILL